MIDNFWISEMSSMTFKDLFLGLNFLHWKTEFLWDFKFIALAGKEPDQPYMPTSMSEYTLEQVAEPIG